MAFKLEFHQVADLPGLERLWQEATDWSQQTFSSLHAWFMEAPFGKPSIVVALDDRSGEIVGQFRFMPSRVSVDGNEVRAYRPFGTIISKAMREAVESNNPFDQPAVAMYRHAITELQARGEQLIYMVPDPRWFRLFKMFPFLQTGSFPLWSLPLPIEELPSLGQGYRAGALIAWDDKRLDQLYSAARRLHGCMVVRDAASLRWKLGNANYTVTAVERGEELVGLVAARAKGDRQWLVCDLLALDDYEAMRATLAAAVGVAHAKSLESNGAQPVHKVAVLVTPVMERAARNLGFVRDDYDFPLVVQVLGESIAPEEVDPARWYVSAND